MYLNVKKIRRRLNSKKVKKQGFTLLELIAVMAIIAIMSVLVTPKIGGYIEEARKTKAVAGVREIVMAVEAYNIKAKDIIGVDSIYSDFKKDLLDTGYLEISMDSDNKEIDLVDDSISYGDLKGIVEGIKEFKLNDNKVELSVSEEQ